MDEGRIFWGVSIPAENLAGKLHYSLRYFCQKSNWKVIWKSPDDCMIFYYPESLQTIPRSGCDGVTHRSIRTKAQKEALTKELNEFLSESGMSPVTPKWLCSYF